MNNESRDHTFITTLNLVVSNKNSLLLAKFGLNSLYELVYKSNQIDYEKLLFIFSYEDTVLITVLESLSEKLTSKSHMDQAKIILKLLLLLFEFVYNSQLYNLIEKDKELSCIFENLHNFSFADTELLKYKIKALYYILLLGITITEETLESVLATIKTTIQTDTYSKNELYEIIDLAFQILALVPTYIEILCEDNFLTKICIVFNDLHKYDDVQKAVNLLEFFSLACDCFIFKSCTQEEKLNIYKFIKNFTKSTSSNVQELSKNILAKLYTQDDLIESLELLSIEDISTEKSINAYYTISACINEVSYAQSLLESDYLDQLVSCIIKIMSTSLKEFNKSLLMAILETLENLCAQSCVLLELVKNDELLSSILSLLQMIMNAKDMEILNQIFTILKLLTETLYLGESKFIANSIQMSFQAFVDFVHVDNFPIRLIIYLNFCSEIENLAEYMFKLGGFNILFSAINKHTLHEYIYNCISCLSNMSVILAKNNFDIKTIEILNDINTVRDFSIVFKNSAVDNLLSTLFCNCIANLMSCKESEILIEPNLIIGLCLTLYFNKISSKTNQFILESLDIFNNIQGILQKTLDFNIESIFPDQLFEYMCTNHILIQNNLVKVEFCYRILDHYINFKLEILNKYDGLEFQTIAYNNKLMQENKSLRTVLFELQCNTIGELLSNSSIAILEQQLPLFCDYIIDENNKEVLESIEDGNKYILIVINNLTNCLKTILNNVNSNICAVYLTTYIAIMNLYNNDKVILYHAAQMYTALINNCNFIASNLALEYEIQDYLVNYLLKMKYKGIYFLEGLVNLYNTVVSSSYIETYKQKLKSKGIVNIITDALEVCDDVIYVIEYLNKVLPLFLSPNELKPKLQAILNKWEYEERNNNINNNKDLLNLISELKYQAYDSNISSFLVKQGILEKIKYTLNNLDNNNNAVVQETLILLNGIASNYEGRKALINMNILEDILNLISKNKSNIISQKTQRTAEYTLNLLNYLTNNLNDVTAIEKHDILPITLKHIVNNTKNDTLVSLGTKYINKISNIALKESYCNIFETDAIATIFDNVEQKLTLNGDSNQNSSFISILNSILACGSRLYQDKLLSNNHFQNFIASELENNNHDINDILSLLSKFDNDKAVIKFFENKLLSKNDIQIVKTFEKIAINMKPSQNTVKNLLDIFTKISKNNEKTNNRLIEYFASNRRISNLINLYDHYNKVNATCINLFESISENSNNIRLLMVEAIELAKNNNIKQLSKILVQISSILKFRLLTPDTQLQELSTFLKQTIKYVYGSTLKILCGSLVVRIATVSLNIYNYIEHVISAVANYDVLCGLFNIVAMHSELYKKSNTTKSTADCITALLYTDYKAIVHAVHAEYPISMDICKYYSNDQIVLNSLLIMIAALNEGKNNINGIYKDKPELAAKQIEDLVALCTNTNVIDNIVNIIKILESITPTAAVNSQISEAIGKIFININNNAYELAKNSNINNIISFCSKIASNPDTKIAIDARNTKNSLLMKLEPNQLVNGNYLSNYFNEIKSNKSLSEDREPLEVLNYLCTIADRNDIKPSQLSSGIIYLLQNQDKNVQDQVNSSIVAYLNSVKKDDLPTWISDANEFNNYLDIIDNALNNYDFVSQIINDINENILNTLAKLIYPYQDAEATDEIQIFKSKINSITNKLTECTNEYGDIVHISLLDGKYIQQIYIPELAGVAPKEALTCRKIYRKLHYESRKNHQISPNTSDDSILIEYFNFVADAITKYSQEPILSKNLFDGDELKWSSLCVKLWLENDYSLADLLIEWNIAEQCFYKNLLCMQSVTGTNKKDADIITYANVALSSIASYCSQGGIWFTTLPNFENTLIENLEIALIDKEICNNSEHILPRLKLIEVTAVDRTIFKNDRLFDCLKKLWDQCDSNKFNDIVLQQVIRIFRRIISPSYLEWVMNNKLINRILSILSTKKEEIIIVDGIFMLGILASSDEIKTEAGNLGAIETIHQLVEDNLSDYGSTKIVLNGLSGLAVLVLNHKLNTNRLIKVNGLITITHILKHRYRNYNEVIAVTAVITNTTYKRDDIKALYGSDKINCPGALVNVLNELYLDNSENCYRALSSLCKVIANLALFTSNVKSFIDEGISNTFLYLLELTNLPEVVLVDIVAAMIHMVKEFSVTTLTDLILYKLCEILSDESIENVLLITNVAIAVQYLIRLNINLQTFKSFDGLTITINILYNWCPYYANLVAPIIGILCICANDVGTAKQLIELNILELISTILNNEYFDENTDISIIVESVEQCFRTLRYLIRSYPSREAFVEYYMNEKLVNWLWYLENLTDEYVIILEELMYYGAAIFYIIGPEDKYLIKQLPIYSAINDVSNNFDQNKAIVQNKNEIDKSIFKYIFSDVYLLGNCIANLCRHCNEIVLNQQNDIFRTIVYILIVIFSNLDAIPGAVESLLQADQSYVLKSLNECFANVIEKLMDLDTIDYALVLTFIFNFGLKFEINNLELHFNKTTPAFKSFIRCINNLPRKHKKAYEKIIDIWSNCLAEKNVNSMAPYTAYFIDPLQFTNVFKDFYVNGTQDLPFKDNLLNGGKCEMILPNDQSNSITIYWRANNDLTLLLWCPANAIPLNTKKVEKKLSNKFNKIISHFTTKLSINKQQIDINSITKCEYDLTDLNVFDNISLVQYKILRGIQTEKMNNYKMNINPKLNPAVCLTLVNKLDQETEYCLIFYNPQECETIFAIFTQWKYTLSK